MRGITPFCVTPPPLAMDEDGLARDLCRHYVQTLGRDELHFSRSHCYQALALAVRDRLMERWRETERRYRTSGSKRAYYLSMEFLLGRALSNCSLNLGLKGALTTVLMRHGQTLEDIESVEHDAGLGNGGLGRLAACFLDSCATLGLPVTGYGIRYEYGMFRQEIESGEQVEEPDHWLQDGNIWEIERPEYTRRIRFGGRVDTFSDAHGRLHKRLVDTRDVLAIPYDVPIPGYRNDTVNTLRLWKAAATNEFQLGEFNAGRYPESVASKNEAEHISMVLYPNDASENGKELRLRQQYFLASASLQDALERWRHEHGGGDFARFPDDNCFQMNDTHPSCAVAELMRLLIDEHGLEWDDAWKLTTRSLAYTNHTLLPEALERWPVTMFARLLPRLLEIIETINGRFLEQVSARWPGDLERQRRLSIFEDGDPPQVRMAHLAVVGSFSVNGVAALHTTLLRQGLFKDFSELWPTRINNKTNGVTVRRWLANCNAPLSRLIDDSIGPGWRTDADKLRDLKGLADDASFGRRWRDIKQQNKRKLAALVATECGVEFPLHALFDVQVKRIHEYKRQLLNLLHVVHLYDRIKRGDTDGMVPRCVLIGGKAAPGYVAAKQIIALINAVADVVNRDADAAGLLKLVFLPNYRVSSMETICPGADLSEQISTAGKEASGTGNMKLMLNGAVTIGTLDGANIEILEEVGEENFFLFGLTAEQVLATQNDYEPNGLIESDNDFRQVMRLLEAGHFHPDQNLVPNALLQGIRSPTDPWVTAADFRSYVDTQHAVAKAFVDQERWTRMSILNTAAAGRFASDRTIAEYNAQIWRLTPPAFPVDSTLATGAANADIMK
ncbi:glycogen/starch/alpha-glucan phosphorylase [Nitrococcus mobilis]|nr:glycogen/starch/alpha-glucan phosphorylase [Nitrococcus mobilis]